MAKPDTAVVVENVDARPAWAAQELRYRVTTASSSRTQDDDTTLTWAVTAQDLDSIPAALGSLVDTVVHVAPLRERTDDILVLARWAGHQTRLREVDFTAAAEQALAAYDWPGNVDELARVVHDAATRSETIDLRHLPPSLQTSGTRRLSRIEVLERDEILRSLAAPHSTVALAAAELGMSRATLYRKLRYYGISRPGHA